METLAPTAALTAFERDRLVRLLQAVPAPRRWAVEHRHGPLLCALGLVDPPDAGYAHAARRRFADGAETRRRALALIDELARDGRMDRAADDGGTSLRSLWGRAP